MLDLIYLGSGLVAYTFIGSRHRQHETCKGLKPLPKRLKSFRISSMERTKLNYSNEPKPRRNPRKMEIPPTRTSSNPPAIFEIAPLKLVKAKYDYKNVVRDGLSFQRGDIFHVVDVRDEDWYEVVKPSEKLRGIVPIAFFKDYEDEHGSMSAPPESQYSLRRRNDNDSLERTSRNHSARPNDGYRPRDLSFESFSVSSDDGDNLPSANAGKKTFGKDADMSTVSATDFANRLFESLSRDHSKREKSSYPGREVGQSHGYPSLARSNGQRSVQNSLGRGNIPLTRERTRRYPDANESDSTLERPTTPRDQRYGSSSRQNGYQAQRNMGNYESSKQPENQATSRSRNAPLTPLSSPPPYNSIERQRTRNTNSPLSPSGRERGGRIPLESHPKESRNDKNLTVDTTLSTTATYEAYGSASPEVDESPKNTRDRTGVVSPRPFQSIERKKKPVGNSAANNADFVGSPRRRDRNEVPSPSPVPSIERRKEPVESSTIKSAEVVQSPGRRERKELPSPIPVPSVKENEESSKESQPQVEASESLRRRDRAEPSSPSPVSTIERKNENAENLAAKRSAAPESPRTRRIRNNGDSPNSFRSLDRKMESIDRAIKKNAEATQPSRFKRTVNEPTSPNSDSTVESNKETARDIFKPTNIVESHDEQLANQRYSSDTEFILSLARPRTKPSERKTESKPLETVQEPKGNTIEHIGEVSASNGWSDTDSDSVGGSVSSQADTHATDSVNIPPIEKLPALDDMIEAEYARSVASVKSVRFEEEDEVEEYEVPEEEEDQDDYFQPGQYLEDGPVENPNGDKLYEVMDISSISISMHSLVAQKWMYHILVTLVDETKLLLYRNYQDFWALLVMMLLHYPAEAGYENSQRLIPFLQKPAKLTEIEVRAMRVYLESFLTSMLHLPEYILYEDKLDRFFQPRTGDVVNPTDQLAGNPDSSEVLMGMISGVHDASKALAKLTIKTSTKEHKWAIRGDTTFEELMELINQDLGLNEFSLQFEDEAGMKVTLLGDYDLELILRLEEVTLYLIQ